MRIEIRADSVVIEGYVNAVARDSRPMRDRKTGKRFVEQIVPGVFERALRHNEVQLLLNHDKSRNLGSTSTNLELYEDSIGQRLRIRKLLKKLGRRSLEAGHLGLGNGTPARRISMTLWNAGMWRIWIWWRFPSLMRENSLATRAPVLR